MSNSSAKSGIHKWKSFANPHLVCGFFPMMYSASKASTGVGWKRSVVVWIISTYWCMLSLAWFRVQIHVCSAEWSSHISIFHSQLHHHAYEEQQTSRKQCECSPSVIITAWSPTQHIHIPHIILLHCVQKWLRHSVSDLLQRGNRSRVIVVSRNRNNLTVSHFSVYVMILE